MIKDEYGNRRFFGVYRGVVYSTDDPLNKGRIKLKVPQIMADAVTGWAWPVVPLTNSGAPLPVPNLGDGVFVSFEGGDPSFPLWIGTFN